MAEFYTWTLPECSLVVLLIASCVMAQTLTTVTSYYRRPRTRPLFFEDLFELFLLFHIIVLSLMMGQGLLSHFTGLIGPTGYIELRYISAGLVILLSCIVFAYRKKGLSLLAIAASCLTMPFFETICGNAYAWIYIFVLIFWLLRGIRVVVLRNCEIKESISALSIKDAIDSLHTGILFSEQDGFIALVNAQMQRLMMLTTGRIHRSSQDFYELLVSGELLSGCIKTEYEGQIVCLLPDETAWVFTQTGIQIKRKQYTQITATDITKQWALTLELQQQEELLILRGEELREMTQGLQALSHTRELQNAKLRAHDILGKRLTVLLHMVNSGQALENNLLRTQLQNLLDDLKTGQQDAASPQEKLAHLRQTFETISVEIQFDGALPENDIIGYIFVDILSESMVNAVRHGFASKIFARSDYVDDVWRLEITDNGQTSPMPINEGGGISGMRSKVEKHSGTLTVTNDPRFILKVELPGGQINV